MEWSEDGHGGAVESTPLDLCIYWEGSALY